MDENTIMKRRREKEVNEQIAESKNRVTQFEQKLTKLVSFMTKLDGKLFTLGDETSSQFKDFRKKFNKIQGEFEYYRETHDKAIEVIRGDTDQILQAKIESYLAELQEVRHEGLE